MFNSNRNHAQTKKFFPKQEFTLKNQLIYFPAIFEVLRDVFLNAEKADKAIEKQMKANKRWRGKERAFVSETVYDIVRWWRLFTTIVGVDNKLDNDLLWKISGVYFIFMGDDEVSEIRNFNSLNINKIKEKLQKYSKVRKLGESYPDWLDQLGEKELGSRWDDVAEALNERPKVILRANELKINKEELQRRIEAEGIKNDRIPGAMSALKLVHPRNVFRTEAFKEGLFEVQDTASQKVSEMLNPKPGMRVVDACAGAGGKTLHIGALMQNKGRIIALDIAEFKLEELRKRARRAGVSIIETKVIDTTKVIKRMAGTADRVLLDVPCTGLGVLRRNPDIKWKLSAEEHERLIKLQQQILISYSRMVKKGGNLVYATCSILPSEGEDQVKKFLTENPGWTLLEEKRYWPDTDQTDGFYMANLKND